MHVALDHDMAHQDAIVELLDLVVRGVPVADFLDLEDAFVALDIARAEHARQGDLAFHAVGAVGRHGDAQHRWLGGRLTARESPQDRHKKGPKHPPPKAPGSSHTHRHFAPLLSSRRGDHKASPVPRQAGDAPVGRS